MARWGIIAISGRKGGDGVGPMLSDLRWVEFETRKEARAAVNFVTHGTDSMIPQAEYDVYGREIRYRVVRLNGGEGE